MLGSRNSKSPRTPRTPRTPNSPRTRKSPRAPRSPVFIDMGSGSLDTSPVSPQAAKWATVVRQASPASPASPQAARRTSPPLPPSYQTTVGVNAPLYSMRSPAAIAAIAKETEYPSKFLAIYYIDMMLGFIEDFANCCIGMLSGIERARYIMAEPHFKHFKDGTINKLIRFKENIKLVRYKYKQGDIETEVKYIEFFLREKDYTSLETSSYYIGLRYIYVKLGHPKRGKEKAKEQHAHISTIIGNTRYSDEKKLEEIQKYTTKENKALVVMINEKTKLNKISLVSVDEKLKLLTEQIKELESIISQNFWTAAGKRKYDEYLENIRLQGTLGGKRAKRGGVGGVGGVGSRIRRLLGIKDKEHRVIPMNEDISQDYMTVVNIYKDTHIDKLRQIYDTIASIFNYAEYHRKNALNKHQRLINEYGYLLKDAGVKRGDYRVDEKNILAILESNRPDLRESNDVVRAITLNFYILNGRKFDLERKISMYYS